MGDAPPGYRVIAWASRLVPASVRAHWRREWEAEVAYAWSLATRDGRPSWPMAMRLRLRVCSCLIDALVQRIEAMTVSGLFDDLRLAIRSLVRNPTFSLISILTLALGIGASTAVFTLVDGVLISPLPFEASEKLIAINHQGRGGADQLPMSTGLYVLYGDQVNAIDGIALYSNATVTLVSDGEPERIAAQGVTPSFFEVLGVEPALGRAYDESEGMPGGASTVILSDGMWRNEFGADPEILDRSLDINGTMRQIVGVMKPGFGFPDRTARLWLPMAVDPANAPLAAFGVQSIARLAPEHTVATASTEIEGLIGRLGDFFPESGAVPFLREVELQSVVRPLKEAVVGNLTSTLWILLGTVGLVLLIACANVANLLLVRAEGRQREFALRVAVGAGRIQVLRSFLSESLVLAGAGGILGVVVAWFAVRTTLGVIPAGFPRVAEVGVDLRVLGFSAVVALVCALFFGFFPLVRFGTEGLSQQLQEGDARGSTLGVRKSRLRAGLVVTQLALAQLLLVGSGLMLRSFQALRDVDPGFVTENVLTARITLPTAEIAGWEAAAGFYRQLGDRLREQPGVDAVGFAQAVPLGAGLGFYSIVVEDEPRGPEDLPVFASNNQVEVGYLEAMGIDLLEGRTFQPGDGAEGARAVVVAKSFADHWWPDRSPVGRRMQLGIANEEWYTIVGIVEDAHYQSLEAPPQEMVYWPATIGPAGGPQATRSMDVAIRTSGDPMQLLPVLRREVAELHPRIPISNPRPMQELFDAATSRVSFTMALLGAASGIALLLGLVGIYGVISYVVSQRTREIGIRMALGATAPGVRGMVVRQGMVIVSLGVAVGLLAALALSSVMESLLYGVGAVDPITYAGVALALGSVSIVACWVPAMRAAGVNPALALRAD